jgi:nicotinic acid mononucleotide adenylyltransferase
MLSAGYGLPDKTPSGRATAPAPTAELRHQTGEGRFAGRFAPSPLCCRFSLAVGGDPLKFIQAWHRRKAAVSTAKIVVAKSEAKIPILHPVRAQNGGLE